MLYDDLVVLIRFDEPSGNDVEVAQGQGIVALQGTADRTTGKFGTALRLNAAGDAAVLQDGWSNRADPVSISCWIYATKLPSAMWGTAPRVLVAKGPGTGEGYFLGNYSGDDLSFRVVDQALSVYEAKFTLASGDLNKWVNIIGVHERDSVAIYKDGTVQDSQLSDGFLKHDETTNVTIGDDWEGLIDEVAVWNRTLDAGDIADVSANAVTIPPADQAESTAVGYALETLLPFVPLPTIWDLLLRVLFDTDTAYDNSGNLNHGTVFGATYEDHHEGRAIVFANPSGLTTVTDYVTFADAGDVGIGDSCILQFAVKTSDTGQLNGRLLATHAATDAGLTNSGIRVSYNTDTRDNLTIFISDGSLQLVLGDEADPIGLLTDDVWHAVVFVLDRYTGYATAWVDGLPYASVALGNLGSVSLGAPVLGAQGSPSSPPDADKRGAIATLDSVILTTMEAREAIDITIPLFVDGFSSVQTQELPYLAAPFLPTVLPIDPSLAWVSSSFDEGTSRLVGEVEYFRTQDVTINRYWEIEIVADQAYMRINNEYPYPVPDSRTTVAIDFTPPEGISLSGTRARYVIESNDAREIYWATDWIDLGESSPGPGPEPTSYPLLVYVNIYEFDEDSTYRVDRTPDVYDGIGGGVDYTWNRVLLRDQEPGPAVVDNKDGAALILETLYPGRFRYRLTAQWPSGESYSQDYILRVWENGAV